MENEELNGEIERRGLRQKSVKLKKPNFTDETALHAMKNGDRDAFTWIFNEYHRKLCIYAEKKIEDREEAEDIVQELFAKLWESRHTIVVTTSLNSYLYKSVNNSCMNHIEHLKKRRIHQDSVLAENSEASYINNPLSMLITKETEMIIEQAINALPEQYSQLIKLKVDEELSYDEIAQKLCIPIGSVGPQLKRARKKVKKIFENEK